MTLPIRQINLKATKIVQQALREGKSLDPGIIKGISKDNTWVPGRPFMAFYRQGFKTNLEVDEHNKMLEDLGDDLSLLYNDLVGNLNEILLDVAATDAYYGRYMHQIRSLNGLTNELILLSPGTNIGMVISDELLDLTNIDQAASDAGFYLQAGFVSLRPVPGSLRLPLQHLRETTNPGLKFSASDAAISDQQGGIKSVIYDTAEGWTFTVATESPRVSVEFDIPLVAQGEADTRISRVELSPYTFTPYFVQVLGSQDGNNFTRFEGNATPKITTRDTLVYLFPERPIRFLRVIMTKESPDGTIETDGDLLYTFNFGLKGLSAYKMGYAKESRMQTKALTPTGAASSKPIDKVTLVADEEIPMDTDILYWLSFDSGANWIAVTPVNRQDGKGVNLVSLDIPTRSSSYEYVDSALATMTTVDSKPFYSLFSFPNEPIPESVRVERGLYGWTYEEGQTKKVTEYITNYIYFEPPQNYDMGEATQPLYKVEYEEIGEHENSDAVNPTRIQTRYPIYPEGDAVITGQRTATEEQPRAAILDIIRQMNPGTISNTTIAITPTIDTLFRDLRDGAPYYPATVTMTNWIGAAPTTLYSTTDGRSVFELVGMPFHYDWTLTSGEADSGVGTIISAVISGNDVILTIMDEVNPMIGGTYAAGSWFIPRMNIKDTVTTVSENSIWLNPLQPLQGDDIVIIKYRRPLLSTEKVFNAVATLEPIGNPADTKDPNLREGRDYKIEGTYFTRISGGHIPIDPNDYNAYVKVVFQVERDVSSLSTYATNVYVEGPGTQTIPLTQITVNTQIGEEAWVDKQRLDGVNSITLTPGWHRLTVHSRSIRMPDNTINKSSAFYQVTNLADDRGRYIMPAYKETSMTGDPATGAFSDYFTRQCAFSDPNLRRATPEYLTRSVKTDRMKEWFAVKGPGEMTATAESRALIGWQPTTDPKVMIFPPDPGGSGEPVLAEMFKITYSFIISETQVDDVILRADLKRYGAEHVTPLLYGYTLRFAF